MKDYFFNDAVLAIQIDRPGLATRWYVSTERNILYASIGIMDLHVQEGDLAPQHFELDTPERAFAHRDTNLIAVKAVINRAIT